MPVSWVIYLFAASLYSADTTSPLSPFSLPEPITVTAQFLRRQIGVILLITGFIIVYISNRYSCQKDMLEIDRLNSELVDAKYRALSTASELTEKCRESNVMEMLQNNKDSVLKIANQPPYIINVPDNYRPMGGNK